MQGGVNNFSAEEATLMLGELYIMRRREGDEFESLLARLGGAADAVNELQAQLLEERNRVEILTTENEKLQKKLARGKR